MRPNNLLAAILLAALTVPSGAQSEPPPQTPAASSSPQSGTTTQSSSGESSSRHSKRRIRVPLDDDESPQPPELAEAESDIDKKDFAAAEAPLQRLVDREPSSYAGWFDLGFVENALGKTADSIAAYRKSVAAKPDVFESNLNLGLQLAKTGQPDAIGFLRAAARLTPASHPSEGLYRAWIALGEASEKSDPAQALDAYRKAAAFQPREAEPHLSMGQILERASRFPEAEAEYRQALSLDPRSTDASIGLANVYMKTRRLPEAEEALRRVLAAQPDSASAHIQLGRVLAAEGKTAPAIDELNAGLKISPLDAAAALDLAQLYGSVGKNDLAEAGYRNLISAHPSDAELHRRLGETLLRERKFPEAQQEFATALRINPNLGEAYSGLAFAAGENKDYALAIRALDSRAKLLPDTPIVYFLRASAYDHLRDFKNAATNYRLFLNSAQGKYPDQEWQAKHRLIAIAPNR